MRKPIMDMNAVVSEGQVVLTWYRRTELLERDPQEEFAWFRIYRQEQPDFTSNMDGQEFFLGLDGQDAELIYEGALPPINERRHEYRDGEVELAKTYTYFVQTACSRRIGPIPVMVRDPEIWWSYEYLLERLNRLVERSSGLARVYTCGQTVAGRNIPCLEVGRGSRVLGLIGLSHAGESGPELMIPALEKLLARSPQLFDLAKVIAIPSQNIDSREEMVRGTPWYIRKNLQGVDLNRNFPGNWEEVDYRYGADSSQPDFETYRGPYPACAPETQAVMSVFSKDHPGVALSFHWLSSICGLPALATAKGAEDREYASKCWRVATLYGEGLFPNGEGLLPEKASSENWLRFAPPGGTLATWFYDLGKIPGLTLEGGITEGGKLSRMNRTDRALLYEYQERHARAMENLLREWPV